MRVWQDDWEVALTLRPFEILLYLMTHPRRVATRDDLLRFRPLSRQDHGARGTPDDGCRAVDVTVLGLRHKLGYNMIDTVRGVGYRLAPIRVDPASSRVAGPLAASPHRRGV